MPYPVASVSIHSLGAESVLATRKHKTQILLSSDDRNSQVARLRHTWRAFRFLNFGLVKEGFLLRDSYFGIPYFGKGWNIRMLRALKTARLWSNYLGMT